MEEYIQRVQRAAAERKGEPIFNGSVDHARVIARTMFKNAHSAVSILAGDLDARVYGPDDVLDEAEFFLSRADHKINILLEEADEHLVVRHPFFKRFRDHENLQVRQLPTELSSSLKFHIMVADGECYRFEEDKSKVAAVAAWGDPKGGKVLEQLFDTLWAVGSPVALNEPANG